MSLIKALEKIELLTLRAGRHAGIANVLDQLIERWLARIDIRALVNPRQKRALPILDFLNRIAAGAHRNEAGEVLIFAAESVRDPRAEARAGHLGMPTVHQHERG